MSIRNVVSYIHVCDCILQAAVQNLTRGGGGVGKEAEICGNDAAVGSRLVCTE